MHGFGAEALPKLADELLTQQPNLLCTLGFDAFQLDIGLGAQLLGDALGVMSRLFDHPCRLGLGFFQRLGVLSIGVGDLLLRLSMLGELRANGLLLIPHHVTDRRHNVFPDEEDDDRESDRADR